MGKRPKDRAERRLLKEKYDKKETPKPLSKDKGQTFWEEFNDQFNGDLKDE